MKVSHAFAGFFDRNRRRNDDYRRWTWGIAGDCTVRSACGTKTAGIVRAAASQCAGAAPRGTHAAADTADVVPAAAPQCAAGIAKDTANATQPSSTLGVAGWAAVRKGGLIAIACNLWVGL